MGDHVLITSGTGLEGTAILAQKFRDVALRAGLSETDLEEAKRPTDSVSIVPEALLARTGGSHGIAALQLR